MSQDKPVTIDLQSFTAQDFLNGTTTAAVRMVDVQKAIDLCSLDYRCVAALLDDDQPVPNEDIVELNCALGRLIDHSQTMLEALALIAANPWPVTNSARDNSAPRGLADLLDRALQSPTVRRNRKRRTSA